MSSSVLSAFLMATAILLAALVSFLIYLWIRYAPKVARIFEDAPVFRPLRVDPPDDGECVRFPTADGLSLAGTYYRHRGAFASRRDHVLP